MDHYKYDRLTGLVALLFAAILGDKAVLSSNPLMRRARPRVSEWSVNYK